MSTSIRPSTSGWLTDLSHERRQELIGATVTLFENLKAINGLLIKVEDGTAHVFRPDAVDPTAFRVAGTRFERTPGTPLRPALARALVYENEWQQTRSTLVDENGEPLDGRTQYDYDSALTAYEEGLSDVHDSLLIELTTQLFPSKES
ncbi:hypothetical protein ACWD9X_14460 [Streptomyces sp. NPDC005075]